MLEGDFEREVDGEEVQPGDVGISGPDPGRTGRAVVATESHERSRPQYGPGPVRSPGYDRRPDSLGRCCLDGQPGEPAPRGRARPSSRRCRPGARGSATPGGRRLPAETVEPGRLPEEPGRRLQEPERIGPDEVEVGRVGRVHLRRQRDGQTGHGAHECPATTTIRRHGDRLTRGSSPGPSRAARPASPVAGRHTRHRAWLPSSRRPGRAARPDARRRPCRISLLDVVESPLVAGPGGRGGRRCGPSLGGRAHRPPHPGGL